MAISLGKFKRVSMYETTKEAQCILETTHEDTVLEKNS